MFRLYSKQCERFMQALAYVVKSGRRQFRAKETCKKARIPEPFTRKVFQKLVHRGFLKAVPGPGGGYRLIKDPARISLHEIILAVDGSDVFEHCVMGLPECGNHAPCPLHASWIKMKDRLIGELKKRKLAELAE